MGSLSTPSKTIVRRWRDIFGKEEYRSQGDLHSRKTVVHSTRLDRSLSGKAISRQLRFPAVDLADTRAFTGTNGLEGRSPLYLRQCNQNSLRVIQSNPQRMISLVNTIIGRLAIHDPAGRGPMHTLHMQALHDRPHQPLVFQ